MNEKEETSFRKQAYKKRMLDSIGHPPNTAGYCFLVPPDYDLELLKEVSREVAFAVHVLIVIQVEEKEEGRT